MHVSRRLPGDRTLNPLTARLAQRRAAGAVLADLTETNPTHVGLGGVDGFALAALADTRALDYAPHPLGLLLAREAVSALHAEARVRVAPDRIALTASTSEAYTHLFRLLCDPGERVLLPAPSYPLFEPLCALEGVEPLRYRLHDAGRWSLDVEQFARGAAAPGVRAAIIVQPNNPTGTCLDDSDRAAVDRVCAEHGVAVISDEVFGEYPRPGHAVPLPTQFGRTEALTFVLGGLSKTCAAPQLKLAWIAVCGPAAACEVAMDGLEWIGDLLLSVSTPVQVALPHLLATRAPVQAAIRQRLAANLRVLAETAQRAPSMSVLPAEGGWSAMLRVPDVQRDEEYALALLERDTVVHPGHFYDTAREGYLVISLLPRPDTFARGLRALEDVLETWTPPADSE